LTEVLEREADEGGYKARAGALTLLFVAGSTEREVLLEMLERALSGGLLGPIGPDDLLDEDELDEYEDEEYDEEDEEYEDEDEDEAALEASPPPLPESERQIGPHTKVRASAKGEQFLFVAFALERWLHNCPDGPLQLGPEGGAAIAPLVCCWSAGVTHALAGQPLTLAELDRAVEALSYETVEEHVEAMERTGQVEALPDNGEARYALTDWAREGIAPIVAAIRYERHYPEDDALPPDVLDVEAAFQLALPLLRLPADVSGSCRLGVQIPGGEPLMAGATAQVAGGRVVSSSTLLEQEPENWATGSPIEWADAVVDPRAGQIKAGGDIRLANALIEALHETLFGPLWV
jgi:DNA-binding transcriptional ArsR family regulator